MTIFGSAKETESPGTFAYEEVKLLARDLADDEGARSSPVADVPGLMQAANEGCDGWPVEASSRSAFGIQLDFEQQTNLASWDRRMSTGTFFSRPAPFRASSPNAFIVFVPGGIGRRSKR